MLLPTETIDLVNTSSAIASAIHAHAQARDDAHQICWKLLLDRKSTKWLDAEKLDSQATNATREGIRNEARQLRFDRRQILSSLEWEQITDKARRREYNETGYRHFVDYHNKGTTDFAQAIFDLFDCDATIGRAESGRVYPVDIDDVSTDEGLSSSSKLRLRIQAIRVARTMRAEQCYSEYRTIGTRLAVSRQIVPSRAAIRSEYVDGLLRDLC